MPIPVPVELDQPLGGGGLLAQSRPLPAGWEKGIKFLDLTCTIPVTMGECPANDSNLKPTEGQAGNAFKFRPFDVILAMKCSTLDNRTDWDALTASELERVKDDAIARELLTGAARDRDLGPDSGPVNALINTSGEVGGDFTTLAAALGCLETATLNNNGGRGATFYMPIAVAWQAMADSLLWRDGARWRTVMGSTVIISAGFDGRGLGNIEDTEPPAGGDNLYVYATTAVWAGTGSTAALHDINRSINDVNARAEQNALVAFDPCNAWAVETPVLACTP